LGRLLNRREAKSKILYTKTMNRLKGEINKSKRKITKKKGILVKIKGWFGLK
jgi:septum formation inhibitor-activating ATPase MinD